MNEITQPEENKLEIVQQAEQMVAKIDRQAFKAMFHLFAGRPDSKKRAYEGQVIIAPEDICDLSSRIGAKFETHNIETEICSVSVGFSKKKTIEFSSFIEFQSQDWKVPEKVEDVTIRWDFMIRIGSYVLPQKHMLTVRIGQNSPGREGMKITVNEITNAVSVMGIGDQCVATVDFISHSLADELLALVGEWHDALRKPENSSGFLAKLEPIDGVVANITRLSIQLAFGMILFAILAKILPYDNNASTITVDIARTLAMFAVAATIGFHLATSIGRFFAGKVYDAINSYGTHHLFNFTRGDEDAHKQITKSDSGAIYTFITSIVLPLVINILAGLVLWKVLP